MVWNKVLFNAGIAVCVGSVLLFSTSASANSRSSAEQAHLEAARALVADYRELRRNCAGQTGEERKSCVHELHANIGDYRLAKQQLELDKSQDPHNVHLVTF